MSRTNQKHETSRENQKEKGGKQRRPDPVTCQKLWVKVQDRVRAIPESELPAQLPRVGILDLVVLLVGFIDEHIRPFIGPALQWVNSKKAELFEAAFVHLEEEAMALFHAEGMRSAYGSLRDQRIREALDRDLAHAESSRALGLHWLELLAGLGRVPGETVQSIRSGRGQLDLASDLVTISTYLAEQWDALKPLQDIESRQEMKLDENGIEAMSLEGKSLLGLLGGIACTDENGIDWRQQVIAIHTLLERDYNVVTAALVFAHQMTGNADELAEIYSLNGLYRRSLQLASSQKTMKDAGASEAEKTETTEPVPVEAAATPSPA
jgi:hypothetical protein